MYTGNVEMLPPGAQAELVAKFIDAELRSGGKGGKSDDALEATLEKALMLFRYIQARAAQRLVRPRALHVCMSAARFVRRFVNLDQRSSTLSG